MSEVMLVAVPSQGVVQKQESHKGARHVANAAVTTAGLGATAGFLGKGINIASGVFSDTIALTNGSKVLQRKTGKVFGFFANLGEKIFKKGSKLGNAIKRYVTGEMPSGGRMADSTQIAAYLKKSKTIGAMALTAGAVAIGLITRAVYNAGKINAES